MSEKEPKARYMLLRRHLTARICLFLTLVTPLVTTTTIAAAAAAEAAAAAAKTVVTTKQQL